MMLREDGSRNEATRRIAGDRTGSVVPVDPVIAPIPLPPIGISAEPRINELIQTIIVAF
jgi:hypothetical protein